MSEARMVSLVIPCCNEAEVLPLTYEALAKEAELWPEPIELVLVDDGSEDGTWRLIESLCERDWRVRGVRLTRNFGHQAALGAGLEAASGEAVVVLDADLQDPPALIREMLARWQAGAEIVYAQRTRRRGETLFKRVAGYCFYRVLSLVKTVPIPRDTGDFCLMDRRVVRTLLSLPEQSLFWRGLRAWTGFRQEAVVFDRPPRARGKSKYTLRKLLQLGGAGLLSFSNLPLRLPLYLGLAGFVPSLALTVAALVQWLVNAEWLITPGVLGLFFFGSVQLLSLGVIGEYLNRIYDEVRKRPRWIVRETAGIAAETTEPGAYQIAAR